MEDVVHTFKEAVVPALSQAGRELGSAIQKSTAEWNAQQKEQQAARVQANLRRARHQRFSSRRAGYVIGGICLLWPVIGSALTAMGALLAGSLIPAGVGAVIVAAVAGWGADQCFKNASALRRAEHYLEFMDGWVGCTLPELANYAHMSVKDLKKDLRMLMQKKYLTGVWLDSKGEVLFCDEQAYKEYMAQRKVEQAAKQVSKVRKDAEKEEPAVREKPGEETAQGVLAAGRRFLKEVAKLRPEVDDEQAGEQVDRMMKVVEDILDWVEQNPASVGKVRRLSRYYLPTTLKLLRTYTSVDDNPGEKAQEICQNITGILYTFNTALLNMQDSLLADTALDVSAEISALEAMLAQEGLAGPSLEMPRIKGGPAPGQDE